MKRLFSLLLSAALLTGAALPAASAADAADTTLTRLTQSVKQTLELDTEDYSSFRGDYTEQELATVWYLYWDGEDSSLSVSALEDGTIVDYSLDADQAVTAPGQSMPTFPQGDPEQAKAAAQAFLERVLDPTVESVVLEEPSGLDSLNGTSYRFSGTILIHGLPSPLSYSITVRAEDNMVTRFWRDVPETSFLGDIPASNADVSQKQAAEQLQSTLSMRLEYILPEGADTAVLYYLPNPVHNFYVDAKTGKLVDLTELQQDMYLFGGENSAAGDAAAPESGLSEAEQAGIQQMEGVRSSQTLDEGLRAVPEYGLKNYELVRSTFSVGEEEEDGQVPVTCLLQYSYSAGDRVSTRTFTVDARTGEVQDIYSYLPWEEGDKAALTAAQAQSRAEAFLQSYYGEQWSHLALYETSGQTAEPLDDSEDGPSYVFQFARQENGYFFPEQYYTVGIDATDGSVCSLSYQYDPSVSFDSPEGVLSDAEALQAWMDTYEVTLGYLLVPQPLDGSDPVEQRLEQMGYTSYYNLKLGYTLERETLYRGIDAKTGEPVSYAWKQEPEGLTYSDLEGHWAQSYAQRLAQYGVGYGGGSFQPDKPLTQWELVCLLYSLQSTPLNPDEADEEIRNAAYSAAYSMGVLTREERNDTAVLTRSQLVQYLLDGAGYGSVAQLEGIFTCAYPDRDSIPADGLGYAALAQGLGLVSGPYAGTRSATRGEAAAMLCRLMER